MQLREGVTILGRLDLSTTAQQQADGSGDEAGGAATGAHQRPTVTHGTADGDEDGDEDDERLEARLLHAMYPDLSEHRLKLRRERDSHRAAFHIKLPTSARTRLWQPHIYPDGNCQRCDAGVVETRCPAVTGKVRTRFGQAFRDTVARTAGDRAGMQRKARKWATDLCMDLAALLAMDWVMWTLL